MLYEKDDMPLWIGVCSASCLFDAFVPFPDLNLEDEPFQPKSGEAEFSSRN